MAKKESKKSKIKKRALSKREDKSGQTFDAEKEADAFDFGGLPDRNMKKNLGCGG